MSSIIVRGRHPLWYIGMAATVVINIFSMVLVFILVLHYLRLGYLFAILTTVFAGVLLWPSTYIAVEGGLDLLNPLTMHRITPSICPRKLIIKRGRVAGFETYYMVECRDPGCGKTYEKVWMDDEHFSRVLMMNFIAFVGHRVGPPSDTPSHEKDLAEMLAKHGVELLSEETLLFHRFYTLEFDRARRAVVVYRPPKEFEKLVGVTNSTIQIAEARNRGDENEYILLIAFKVSVKAERSEYVFSTCLLGVMKSGHVWLNQTPHTLPLRLGDHLAWSMGLNPGDSVVEADRGGLVWRPRPPRRQRS